jgi:nanoRNase/pAp phosphatase (c-di-AMP/oligoRNAs hydrolase)
MNLKNKRFDTQTQLDALIEFLKKKKRLLILTHGNPDPDALAGAFTLKYLASQLTRCQARVSFPGIIGRRENRAMVRELSLKMLPLEEVKWRDYDSLALVDHQPRRRMYAWPKDRWPNIVIDHHPRRPLEKPVSFVDIRTDFGSSSSLLAHYLFAAGISAPRWLSTALVYGIKTDTQEFSRGHIEADKNAYMHLFRSVDHRKLQKITHPLMDCTYLSHYWHGIKAAKKWNDAAESYIGDVPSPDYTAEIADHLMMVQGIRYVLVSGFFDHMLFMSLRINNPRRDAGVLLRKVVGRKGSAGGHGFMAGAQIPDIDSVTAAKEVASKLHRQFIKTLHPGLRIHDGRVILKD